MSEHISWHLDHRSWGGLVPERLLAALPLADGLYCGLVFTFDSPGAPRVQFWERIDDLEQQGFAPIRPARARAICDALPRFLDRLEQAIGVRRSALGEAADDASSIAYPLSPSASAGVSLC